MLKVLPLLLNDGYKVGHKFQYPEGTTCVYSNLTARKGRNPNFNRKARRASQKQGVVFLGFLTHIPKSRWKWEGPNLH